MGLEKVLAEIKDSGIQIGEERGMQQAQQKIAKQIDLVLIAELTRLPLEKIKKLQN